MKAFEQVQEAANTHGYKPFVGEVKQTEAFDPSKAGMPRGTEITFIAAAGLVLAKSSNREFAAIAAKTADRNATIGWSSIIGDTYMIDDAEFNPAEHDGEPVNDIEGIFRCHRYGKQAHGASLVKAQKGDTTYYEEVKGLPEKITLDAESNIVPVKWDSENREFVIDGAQKLRKGAGYVSDGKVAA